MVRTECFFFDCKGALKERLGLRIAALRTVKKGEVIEMSGDLPVARAERLFIDRECAQIKRLGLSKAGLAR